MTAALDACSRRKDRRPDLPAWAFGSSRPALRLNQARRDEAGEVGAGVGAGGDDPTARRQRPW